MKKITLYSDGASRGNPGKGGWGVVLLYGKIHKTFYGFVNNVTNNQMELTAAIRGLEQLKEPCHVTLYTDSKYVVDGMKTWIINWKKNAWRTQANQPVKNQELWKQLEKLNSIHKIDWFWVKGHSGNINNELADALANKAIDEQI